jgi:hypothetical protein
VGLAVVKGGERVVVTISDRFGGDPDASQILSVIDPRLMDRGAAAVVGSIPAGSFPRELWLMPDGSTLLVTNYTSRTLQLVDLERVLG